MPNQQTDSTPAETPDGAAKKMSQILLDIAEPLVETMSLPADFAPYRISLNVACAVWNASRLPAADGRREALDLIVNTLVDQMGCPQEEAQRVTGEVYLLARQRYAEERRLIESVHVEMVGEDRVRIDVKSAEIEGGS